MDFITFGVKRPIFGSLLMWFLVLGGIAALLIMRREFFPPVEPEAARIALLYPGASPAEVEESMARKIEDAVIDVEGAKRVTSSLVEGGGGILVEFDDGTRFPVVRVAAVDRDSDIAIVIVDCRDRPFRLSQPGEQRPWFPLHLPWSARCARHDHQ